MLSKPGPGLARNQTISSDGFIDARNDHCPYIRQQDQPPQDEEYVIESLEVSSRSFVIGQLVEELRVGPRSWEEKVDDNDWKNEAAGYLYSLLDRRSCIHDWGQGSSTDQFGFSPTSVETKSHA